MGGTKKATVQVLPARVEEVRDDLAAWDRRVREAVADHPLWCVAGALTAGYLVGRLIARRG